MANLAIIRDLCKVRQITLRRLAREIGTTEGAIHIALRTGRTSIETLEKIAAVLEVHPGVFFDSPYQSPYENNDLKPRFNRLVSQITQALNEAQQERPSDDN